MNRIFIVGPIAGIFAACAFLAESASAQEQHTQQVRYTITDLGMANGSTPGQPFAIKNGSWIAESSPVSDAFHATLLFRGSVIDLAKSGGLGGPNSAAFGVNNRGQGGGEAETANADPKGEDFCGFGTQLVCDAFVSRGSTMSALPMLTDATGVAGHNAAAKDINNWGQVAGAAENSTIDSTCPAYDPSLLQFQTYQFKPVIWTGGNVHALPTSGVDASGNPFSDPDGVVFRINDSGQAVGATGSCSGFTSFLTYLNAVHATLWQKGAVIDLGSLGGIAPPGFGNFAYDINRFGHVVGTSGTSDGTFHAFFWSPETQIQDLGTVPGDSATAGLAISDTGIVGGVSFPADPTASPRAFVMAHGGTAVDLNSLVTGTTGLYLFSACSINSHGDVIGLAFDAQGNFHGYLATPGAAADDVSSASLTAREGWARYAWSAARGRMGSFGR